MVKYILTKLSIVIGFFGAFATPQSPNILVYNGDTKSRQSTYSQNARKLLNFIYTNIDWDKLPKQQMPIRVITRFSANEDGKIDEVEIMRKSDNEIFNQEAVRVIKSIPDWDVIFLRGRPYRQWFSMAIIFSKENRKKYGK